MTNHFIYLNSAPMVKNMLKVREGEGFKLSHLHFKLVGLGGLSF